LQYLARLVSGELHAWTELVVMGVPGRLGDALRLGYFRRRLRSVGTGCRFCRGIEIQHPEGLSVGDRTGIGAAVINARAGVTIGKDCLIASGTRIWSINHRFADPLTPISRQGYDHEPVVIGDDVLISTNAIILRGHNRPGRRRGRVGRRDPWGSAPVHHRRGRPRQADRAAGRMAPGCPDSRSRAAPRGIGDAAPTGRPES
jgi:acetyltransferase-like isoleucine patch superfamily enzyme